MQLTAQLEVVELGVVRVRERDGLRRALVLRHELLEQLARRLLHVQLRIRLEVLGELRRERGVGGHRHAPRGVAQEEAARPVHRVRLGELAEGGGRGAVPGVEDREVRLAVLAELERHLGGRRRLSGAQRARARDCQVVEPEALELLEQRRVLLAEREQHAPVARVDSRGELGGLVALKRADEEMAATVARHDRADGPPAVRVAQPGQHVRARHEVGEAREQRLDRLRHARVRGHAPVLAAPVEPAPRQLLDRLVQVLVEGKVEDQLGLARVVSEQPDLARGGRRLVLNRVDGQTDELSGDRGVPTGAPPRRPPARRAARPQALGRALRRTARRGPSPPPRAAGRRWRSGPPGSAHRKPRPDLGHAARVLGLVREQRHHHERHSGGDRAERRPRPAVDNRRGRVAEHVLLRHPALDPHVGGRVRQGAEVELTADREEDAHGEVGHGPHRHVVHRERLREAAGDAAERHVHERVVAAAGPPVGQLTRLGVPRGVVEAVCVGLGALVERLGEDGQVGRAPQPVRGGIGRKPLRPADGVDRTRRDPERELLARGEADRHARVRDAVQLRRERRAVLVRVAQHDVRPPFLARCAQARQRRGAVQPAEDLADRPRRSPPRAGAAARAPRLRRARPPAAGRTARSRTRRSRRVRRGPADRRPAPRGSRVRRPARTERAG